MYDTLLKGVTSTAAQGGAPVLTLDLLTTMTIISTTVTLSTLLLLSAMLTHSKVVPGLLTTRTWSTLSSVMWPTLPLTIVISLFSAPLTGTTATLGLKVFTRLVTVRTRSLRLRTTTLPTEWSFGVRLSMTVPWRPVVIWCLPFLPSRLTTTFISRMIALVQPAQFIGNRVPGITFENKLSYPPTWHQQGIHPWNPHDSSHPVSSAMHTPEFVQQESDPKICLIWLIP